MVFVAGCEMLFTVVVVHDSGRLTQGTQGTERTEGTERTSESCPFGPFGPFRPFSPFPESDDVGVLRLHRVDFIGSGEEGIQHAGIEMVSATFFEDLGTFLPGECLLVWPIAAERDTDQS